MPRERRPRGSRPTLPDRLTATPRSAPRNRWQTEFSLRITTPSATVGTLSTGLGERRVSMTHAGQPARLAGSTMGPHNHVCAFFQNREEEYKLLLPFIAEGFERGERAFHIVDPSLRSDHLHRLGRAGIPVDSAGDSQLEVHDW